MILDFSYDKKDKQVDNNNYNNNDNYESYHRNKINFYQQDNVKGKAFLNHKLHELQNPPDEHENSNFYQAAGDKFYNLKEVLEKNLFPYKEKYNEAINCNKNFYDDNELSNKTPGIASFEKEHTNLQYDKNVNSPWNKNPKYEKISLEEVLNLFDIESSNLVKESPMVQEKIIFEYKRNRQFPECNKRNQFSNNNNSYIQKFHNKRKINPNYFSLRSDNTFQECKNSDKNALKSQMYTRKFKSKHKEKNGNMINNYLEKRHCDSVQKINEQRFAQQQMEMKHIQKKPVINKKSEEMVRSMSDRHNANVFDRLTGEQNVQYYTINKEHKEKTVH